MKRREFITATGAGGLGVLAPRRDERGGPARQGVMADERTETLDQLKHVTPKADSLVLVEGYHAPGDGGGGLFVWSEDRKSKEVGGPRAQDALWVASDVADGGRWFRVIHDFPFINAKWFGARGDGETDDAKAINDAIWVAGYLERHNTFLPAGEYRVEDPIVISWPSGQCLRGESPQATIISKVEGGTHPLNAGGAVDAAVLIPPAGEGEDPQDAEFVTIQGLRLQGDGTGEVPYGLYVEGTYDSTFRNLKIYDVQTALYADRLWMSRLTRIRSKRVGKFIHIGGTEKTSPGLATSLEISNCYVDHTQDNAFTLVDAHYSTIQNCGADKVEGWPYAIESSRSVNLIGCGFERSRQGRGILFRGASGNVMGCEAILPHENVEGSGAWSIFKAVQDDRGRPSRVAVTGSFFGNLRTAAGASASRSEIDAAHNYNRIVGPRSNVTFINTRLPKNANEALNPAGEPAQVLDIDGESISEIGG